MLIRVKGRPWQAVKDDDAQSWGVALTATPPTTPYPSHDMAPLSYKGKLDV
jgi:hypothetical protein